MLEKIVMWHKEACLFEMLATYFLFGGVTYLFVSLYMESDTKMLLGFLSLLSFLVIVFGTVLIYLKLKFQAFMDSQK